MTQPPKPWFSLPAEEVARLLDVNLAQGLSSEEARRRLEHFGPNRLPEEGMPPLWKMLLAQFTEAMVILLLVAAGISWAMGDTKEAIAILAIVVINAILGFTQEYRAERALAALRKLAVPTVRVRRDGLVLEISAEDVVPGDVVILEAGDAVPADARLVLASELRTDESALTGESEPVAKRVEPLEMDVVPVAEQRNMVFMGTWVTYGHGEAVVVATGLRTELGKIASMLRSVEREPTPLQRRLARLGRDLTLAAVALIVVVFVLGLLQGQDARTMFITAISLAVAAVPEGLPAVVTIALALGAQRMLRRHALIRKLPAVETLGSVTTICTDKTGTLTQNRMSVVVLNGFGKKCDVADLRSRYHDVMVQASPAQALKALAQDPDFPVMLIAAALCNNAAYVPPENGHGPRAIGDPTEAALVVAAAEFGLPKTDLEHIFPRVAEVPFTSERKRMTTVHAVSLEALEVYPHLKALWKQVFTSVDVPRYVAFVKGAPDVLLERSTRLWKDVQVQPLRPEDRAKLLAENEHLARQGIRVLGVALRGLERLPEHDVLADEAEQDLIFVGLVGMMDPLRPEAKDAVRTCREAGIEVKMITGDHPATARTIARELGLLTEDNEDAAVMTGYELETLPAEVLAERLERVRVFARVAPEHKLRIVEALQAHGHITAMTGDGVNDAPALKKADIGVAMGQIGTEVAKEAADMVLLDDNFATIVAAVEEGRVIYDNVRRFIQYTLSSNAGEIFIMLLAPLLGMPVPLTALQILWINLVTDGLPGLALTVEPPEKDVMKRPPYPPQESILGRGLGRDVLWVGILLGLLALLPGWWLWRQGRETWQTMLFSVLALSQMSNAWALRSYTESIFSRGLFTNLPLLGSILLTFILQAAVIYLPPLQTIFHTRPLSLGEFMLATAFIPAVLIAFEIKKVLIRRGVLKY